MQVQNFKFLIMFLEGKIRKFRIHRFPDFLISPFTGNFFGNPRNRRFFVEKMFFDQKLKSRIFKLNEHSRFQRPPLIRSFRNHEMTDFHTFRCKNIVIRGNRDNFCIYREKTICATFTNYFLSTRE